MACEDPEDLEPDEELPECPECGAAPKEDHDSDCPNLPRRKHVEEHSLEN